MSSDDTKTITRLKQTSIASASVISDLCMNIDMDKFPEQAFGMWKIKGPATARNQIHCKICYMFPEIVKIWKTNNKNPNIMLQRGVQNRSSSVLNHIQTNYHQKCLMAYKRKQLEIRQNTNDSVGENPIKQESELEKLITKGNAELAKTVANFAYSVYNDAIRLTLSAYSWPSRFVAQELGRLFDFSKSHESEEKIKKINLQYINPCMHSELLTCIVEADRNDIKTRIENAIAISVRVDGSVDRTNIDKIYVLAKIVNRQGVLENLFIGVGEQTERLAIGLHQAVIRTMNRVHQNLYEICVRKMTSFVTDGASVNVGDRKGLWTLIDNDLKKFYDGQEAMMQVILKIWCAAHRSDLALKDVTSQFEEFSEIIHILSKIASYFNTSSMRHEELIAIAKENNFKLYRIPKYFKVRWSQFTFELLETVLISWQAIVTYFSSLKKPGSSEIQYLEYLTNYYNLRIISFMADLLCVFKRFQIKIQADNLNLITLKVDFDNLISSLERLNDGPANGGWEKELNDSVSLTIDINKPDSTIYQLRDIQLHNGTPKQIVTRTDFEVLRRDVINSFIALLTDRFIVENEAMEFLQPFVAFDKHKTDLTKIHKYIAPDIDVLALDMQYNEIANTPGLHGMTLQQIILHLKKSASVYDDLITVFARIMCATPHSADVERLVSANNLLKTSMRNSLKIETENKYLHIHYNMPSLLDWNVRDTVLHWLTKKQRRQHNIHLENDKRKAKSQTYFNGVFDNKNRHIYDEEIQKDGYDNIIQGNNKRQRTF